MKNNTVIRVQSHGFVALITILIVGAVSLAVALALLVAGTDSQRWVLVQQQAGSARQVASACAEEALQQLQDDTAYIGSGNVSSGGITCTYNVVNTGATTRDIDISTSGSKVVRKLKVYVTISTTAISVTSWQEVN